jgi:hypothetical protein
MMRSAVNIVDAGRGKAPLLPGSHGARAAPKSSTGRGGTGQRQQKCRVCPESPAQDQRLDFETSLGEELHQQQKKETSH